MVDYGQVAAAAANREFLNLPHELLQTLLECCEPQSLGRLSRTCSAFRTFIFDNELLWKNVYLACCDYPRSEAEAFSWKTGVKDLVTTQQLLRCTDLEVKRAERATVGATIIKLLRSTSSDAAQSLNLRLLQESFADKSNQDAFLCGSSLFALLDPQDPQAGWQLADTDRERQLLAQLHCLYGAPRYGWVADDPDWDTLAFAKAKVYDLHHYTRNTMWGPFKDDDTGDVDWEKLEAIMTVLGYNLKLYSEQTNRRFREPWTEENAWLGASPYSFIASKAMRGDFEVDPHMDASTQQALEQRDPYGVTGTWHRIVCFINYPEFFHFNFRAGGSAAQSRQQLEEDEAVRLIVMRFRVTKVEDQADGILPIVYFAGDSNTMLGAPGANANSDIMGVVRQTPQGEIRWTTWSVYYGEKRWRSEGIQVGGIQSARGVVGNWFETEYDPHGPAGPTAFWKVMNEVEGLSDAHDRLKAARLGVWEDDG